MSKLLERLQDASRSGVYRASRSETIAEVVRGSALDLAVIGLGKEPLFESFAAALKFPGWFGGNWDALEDCLADLSWREARGHVLVIEKPEALPRDELGVLLDVLTTVAEFWAEQEKPFFAVFVDPARALRLPDLYRES